MLSRKNRRHIVLACVTLLALQYAEAAAVAKESNVFSRVWQHGTGDLGSTLASWPVVILIGGAITAACVAPFDDTLQSRFRAGRHLGRMDSIGDIVGGPFVVDGAAALLFGVGVLAHQSALAATGEELSEALVLTEMMAGGLKFIVNRDRPDGSKYSFPSAHAARLFAMASVLEARHGPFLGIPAYLAAGAVAYTRLDANVHHVSDVIFGAALGSAIGWGTAHFHAKAATKFFIAPIIGPAPGLMVSRSF